MKKNLMLLLLVLLVSLPAAAQKKHDRNKDHEAKKQEMLAFKLDFITSEMDLKADQKKKFEEVYTRMENERRSILKKIKKAEKSISDNKEATEADYERAAKEISSARNEMVQIESKYDEEFATFLSGKQLYKMKEAENQFMLKMQSCRDKKKKENKSK